jgi:chromosome segregation ATPase
MDITDIDSSNEDQEMQILNLRRLLAESEYRIDQIRSELDDVSSRRDILEREHAANVTRSARIKEQIDLLRASLRAVLQAAEEIGKAMSE